MLEGIKRFFKSILIRERTLNDLRENLKGWQKLAESYRAQIEILEKDLDFERSRAQEERQIFYKRFGIIQEQRNDVPQNFKPIGKKTFHEVRANAIKHDRKFWEDKVEAEEKSQ